MSIDQNFRCFRVFLEYDLVVMAIDRNACYIVLWLDIQCDIVVIDYQTLCLSHLLLLLAVLICSASSLPLLWIRLEVIVLRPPTFIALKLIDLLLHCSVI